MTSFMILATSKGLCIVFGYVYYFLRNDDVQPAACCFFPQKLYIFSFLPLPSILWRFLTNPDLSWGNKFKGATERKNVPLKIIPSSINREAFTCTHLQHQWRKEMKQIIMEYHQTLPGVRLVLDPQYFCLRTGSQVYKSFNDFLPIIVDIIIAQLVV